MKMNDKMKRWLTIAGCLAICAVLVALISAQFVRETPQDSLILSPEDEEAGDVTINTEIPSTDTEPEAGEAGSSEDAGVTINIPSSSAGQTTEDNGARSTGTEQAIQGDVSKPEYDVETLTDPTKTPDGTPVDGDPVAEDHDSVSVPDTPVTSGPQPGDTNGGQIYVPGFGWIDEIGEGEGTFSDGEGDINKQVGIMG